MTIRNLDDEIRDGLRVQAARKGRSLEAEAREILRKGLERPKPDRAAIDRAIAEFQECLRAANGGALPTGMIDELIASRRAEAAKELAEMERYGK